MLQISSLLPFMCYSVDDRCLNGANSMAARRVDHVMMVSGNDDEGDDGGSPELLMERQLRNGGMLWEPLRVPSAAKRQRHRVLADHNDSIKWRRRKKRQL